MFLFRSLHIKRISSSKLLTTFKSHPTSCTPKPPLYRYTHTLSLTQTHPPSLWEVCSIHNPYQNLTWIINEREWEKISVPIISLSIYNYILNYLLHIWSWGKERWVCASWFMAHHATYSSYPWGRHNSTNRLSQLHKWEVPWGNTG